MLLKKIIQILFEIIKKWYLWTKNILESIDTSRYENFENISLFITLFPSLLRYLVNLHFEFDDWFPFNAIIVQISTKLFLYLYFKFVQCEILQTKASRTLYSHIFYRNKEKNRMFKLEFIKALKLIEFFCNILSQFIAISINITQYIYIKLLCEKFFMTIKGVWFPELQ